MPNRISHPGTRLSASIYSIHWRITIGLRSLLTTPSADTVGTPSATLTSDCTGDGPPAPAMHVADNRVLHPEASQFINEFESIFPSTIPWYKTPPALRSRLILDFGLGPDCTTLFTPAHHAALALSSASTSLRRIYIITPDQTWSFTTPPEVYYPPFETWDSHPTMPTGSRIRGELIPLLNLEVPQFKSVEAALHLHFAISTLAPGQRTSFELTSFKQTADILGNPTQYYGTLNPYTPWMVKAGVSALCATHLTSLNGA